MKFVFDVPPQFCTRTETVEPRAMPPGAVTRSAPAPASTTVACCVPKSTVGLAPSPPIRFVPRMVTAVPAGPSAAPPPTFTSVIAGTWQ